MAMTPGEPLTDPANTIGYWVDAPGRGSLRQVELPTQPEDAVLLQALCTGVSVGTERLVGLGHVPAELTEAMACRGMQGTFDLPALYGYSFVGLVIDGPDRGRRAFVMRPHQRQAIAPRSELHWLPDSLPAARATLFPNLETARNAVWDADLKGHESIAVIGGGAVGLLVAFVLSLEHSGPITVVERDSTRRQLVSELPWIAHVVAPQDVALGALDVAFHTSGTAEGLQLAIDISGFEGSVYELSWYGGRAVELQLGYSFHYQRKRIIASQVGTVANSRRDQGISGRAKAVLDLLGSSQLDAMLSEPVAFADLPGTFAAIYAGQPVPLSPVVIYE
ncbi:zinc-binding alcohol dehydrogenase [bacterium]|nr:zinc-binding alcohol dehydrogenase [bacterium]